MKVPTLILVLSALAATLSCGGGGNSSTASSSITGNWQFTLTRHNSTEVWTFAGFLVQSGNSVAGSVTVNAGCQGVGPVTGTFDGKTLQLTLGALGQDFSLSADLPAGSSMGTITGGQFSTLQGGCIGFSSTGTWSAVRISPLAGAFHGTFVSEATPKNADLDVTGTLTQGTNIGASNATVSGTITAGGSSRFCSYLSTASVTGTISGPVLTLTLFGPNGSQIGQIPAGVTGTPAILTPDATSLTASYNFEAISKSCPGDQGTVTLTFP